MKLSKIDKQIIQEVYDHFKANNDWPSSRELEITYHEYGDYFQMVEKMGNNLIYNYQDHGDQYRTKLRIEGISICRGKTFDLDNFVQAIRLFYDKYIKFRGPTSITKSEMKEALDINDSEIERLCILISESYPNIHAGGSRGEGNKYLSTFDISNFILKFKNIDSIEKYVNFWGKETNSSQESEIREKFVYDLDGEDNIGRSIHEFVSEIGYYEIHPEILKVCNRLFKDKHYAQAVEESLKRVITEVKNIVKLRTKKEYDGGDSIMNHTFTEKNPIIKVNKNKTKEEKDEQKGMMFLFKGIVGIRNRIAHDNIILDDPKRTFEYLTLASLLMRMLDLSKNFED